MMRPWRQLRCIMQAVPRTVVPCALPACAVFLTVACRSTAPVRASAPAPRQPEPVAPAMTPAAATFPDRNRDRDRVRALADSVLRAPAWSNARWGILIVDAASGDTIVSHDADKLFMPASNQKLLTAAIALQHLGPDFTWQTPVLLHGRQRGTVWEGDLLIAGTGDPSFSDSLRGGDAASAFDPVAQALAARGIRRIAGTVRAHADAFPGITTGFGWEIDDLDGSYGAPVDELLFNEGELSLRVRSGARAGAPVNLVRRSPALYPRFVNRAVTRDSGDRDEGAARLRAEYDSVASAIVVTGTLLRGDSAALRLSYRHPADATIAELSARIASAGIAIRGDSLRIAPDTLLDTLVVLQSPPLSAVMARMQKPSQNQIAELLFRTVGLRVSGHGSADSARAVAARTLAAWGVLNDDVAYRDGSGMSRHDYVTPRALVRVLDTMRRAPSFDVYRNALPVAGVDGTLRTRMRGTAAAGNAQAKTGTVDKARSLTGYVTTADGRLVMFSMLSNNFTVPTREVERVQDLLVVALANARLGDGTPAGVR
jgi:D-alanyl-D-alanine carboxypeptidase/D-alanyl-D-alanine-endopeptidase (penicillin-binding protein 4)